MTDSTTPARRAALWAVGMVVALALGVSACGDNASDGGSGATSAGGANAASAPGITETTVTIGSHQPLTGFAAPGFAEVAPASRAYFDYINRQGGIHGRKIVYKVEDDAYNPAKTAGAVRKLVAEDGVFAIYNGLGTAAHSAAIGYLNAARVPDLFVPACSCFNHPDRYPYTFGWQTSYVIEGKVLGKYIAESFRGKKIGYLYQNDDLGQDGVKGLDTQIPADQVVDRQTYSPTNPSLSSQVASLKAKGAEVVVMFAVPTFSANFLLTAKQLGYHPQPVVNTIASDPATLTTLLKAFSRGKADTSMIDGIITDAALPSVTDDSNSWTRLFKKIHDQDPTVSRFPYDANVRFGMASAYSFAQALEAAGPNPTRESFVEALESSDFSANNPGLGPLRYSDADHGGLGGSQVGRIEQGEITLSGPVWTTDAEDGPITEFTGEKAEAPADGLPPKQG